MPPLSAESIFTERLRTLCGRSRGEVLDSVSSTMDVARDRLIDGAPDGYAVLADYQSDGRGRTGPWQSPGGLSVLMSVVLHIGLPAAEQRRIVHTGAVAAAEAVNRFGVAARIKWPNDIVVTDSGIRKLGGMIVQRVERPDGSFGYVLGMGINVNQTPDDLPGNLPVPATSVRIERGRLTSRSALCASIIERLDEWYRILRLGFPERIEARWQSFLVE
jgi:BirA family transcriptional regulator, biotin operon repressor / biotin---[acetyl-CoA-carboxylase] ligase